jgi:ABC-2 type transport system permease protein
MSHSETIQLVNESGGFRGFVNLLHKENSLWWGTRKWWTQILIWLLISNGLIALISWIIPAIDSTASVPPASEMMSVFLMTHGTFATIGVMILVQSAIVGEKRSGTAEWILSNPVSRSAFILSKLFGNALGIMVILVSFQSAIAYLQISLSIGFFPPLVPYLKAIGLLSLTLLFYLTFSLMLGTIFKTRGPVIGISIGVLVIQSILRQLALNWVPWLPLVMPDTLMQLASPIVQGQPLPTYWPIPIIFTALMSILCVLIAMWRFNREEF